MTSGDSEDQPDEFNVDWSLFVVFCCSESSKGLPSRHRFDTLPAADVSQAACFVLGRIHGATFSDSARHPTNERFPGLFLFRVEAPLLYFNVNAVIR